MVAPLDRVVKACTRTRAGSRLDDDKIMESIINPMADLLLHKGMAQIYH